MLFVLIAGQSTTGQLISTVLRRAAADPDVWSWVPSGGRPSPDADGYRVPIPRSSPIPRGSARTGRTADGIALPAPAEQPMALLCPHRQNSRWHLSFGVGRHRCPGALTARTEAAVALRMVANQLPDVELAETEPPMLGLLSFRAPERVTVRRTAGPSRPRALPA
ncbi:cytochrome P450 [Streptomyces malaysiensis]|uniref:Cytochrome P450 n=1 Tax=Streptomyces malaysiensis TaxID=92644 RepID=A0A7X6B1G7_STRMQ|nr:cytochrome P450 [Streptomyces malaysiensis]